MQRVIEANPINQFDVIQNVVKFLEIAGQHDAAARFSQGGCAAFSHIHSLKNKEGQQALDEWNHKLRIISHWDGERGTLDSSSELISVLREVGQALYNHYRPTPVSALSSLQQYFPADSNEHIKLVGRFYQKDLKTLFQNRGIFKGAYCLLTNLNVSSAFGEGRHVMSIQHDYTSRRWNFYDSSEDLLHPYKTYDSPKGLLTLFSKFKEKYDCNEFEFAFHSFGEKGKSQNSLLNDVYENIFQTYLDKNRIQAFISVNVFPLFLQHHPTLAKRLLDRVLEEKSSNGLIYQQVKFLCESDSQEQMFSAGKRFSESSENISNLRFILDFKSDEDIAPEIKTSLAAICNDVVLEEEKTCAPLNSEVPVITVACTTNKTVTQEIVNTQQVEMQLKGYITFDIFRRQVARKLDITPRSSIQTLYLMRHEHLDEEPIVLNDARSYMKFKYNLKDENEPFIVTVNLPEVVQVDLPNQGQEAKVSIVPDASVSALTSILFTTFSALPATVMDQHIPIVEDGDSDSDDNMLIAD